jgi:phage-related protein
MGDIYNINNWAAGTLYVEDSIVLVGNLFYYSTTPHTSGATFATDLAAGKWNGYLANDNEQKPYFFWRASYRYNLDIKPFVKKIQMGDGYISEFNDGINNILLPFNALFEDRDLNQYTAILHFLTARAGTEQFYFIPPVPFNVVKKFVCQEYSATQNFYNKYTITANFSERV